MGTIAPFARLALTLQTMRFGAPEEVAVDPSRLYTFPEALPGLPESHRYALVEDDAYAPLCWLQSLDEGPVCLPVVAHTVLDLDGYAAQVVSMLDEEGMASAASAASVSAVGGTRVMLVTRFDEDAGLFAVNPLAPILLDGDTATGRQVVLDGQDYPLRQHVRWDATSGRFVPVC